MCLYLDRNQHGLHSGLFGLRYVVYTESLRFLFLYKPHMRNDPNFSMNFSVDTCSILTPCRLEEKFLERKKVLCIKFGVPHSHVTVDKTKH